MARPTTTFVRRGEIVRWLGEHGISAWEVKRTLASGVIVKRPIREGGRAHFLVAEIEEKILAPLLARKGEKV